LLATDANTRIGPPVAGVGGDASAVLVSSLGGGSVAGGGVLVVPNSVCVDFETLEVGKLVVSVCETPVPPQNWLHALV
jgi:hypothetical protein